MTFKRFLDTFKSGTKLVYVAKEYVPGYVPHGKTRTQVPSSAAVRLTARGSVGLSRYGVTTPADIAARKERMLSYDFSVHG